MKRSICLVAALTLVFAGVYAGFPHRVTALIKQDTATSPQPSDSLSQQLVQKSREAAGEDENTQFKHSTSVQMIARLTRLSLENAYWLSVILNFAIIAIVMFWLLKKTLPGTFRNRTALIQRAMEEARKASEDAQRRLTEVEGRLSRLDGEIAQMRTAAETEAVDEERKIVVAAEEDARKIVQQTEQEIAAAIKSARRELTAYAADLAVTLAQKQIHVDSNIDQMLVQRFAQQLAKNNGGSSKGGQ